VFPLFLLPASCFCGLIGDRAMATLLDQIPGTVFTAGDNAYPDGTLDDFNKCYGSTWGRHKARTRPRGHRAPSRLRALRASQCSRCARSRARHP